MRDCKCVVSASGIPEVKHALWRADSRNQVDVAAVVDAVHIESLAGLILRRHPLTQYVQHSFIVEKVD